MNVDNYQPELIAKTLPPIQCDGCTRCCHSDAVRLLPGDDESGPYQTEPHPQHPGQLMLAHKPDGSCVYVTESGCSIHDRAPQMCRKMDCRIIASRVGFTDARKLAAKNILPMAVWRRGRELLRKAAVNA